jgi:GNAT superfamily N-acetyltransferase
MVYAKTMDALSQLEFSIRPVTPGDEQALFALIQALAEYEKLTHAVTGTAEQLARDLFDPSPRVEALLVEADGRAIAFALYFHNYSTFLTKFGLYLEDIFVLPEYRGRGVGKALLSRVAKVACERGCGRLEWSVLDWNESAIGFYKGLGAAILPDWRICRMVGAQITALAECV